MYKSILYLFFIIYSGLSYSNELTQDDFKNAANRIKHTYEIQYHNLNSG